MCDALIQVIRKLHTAPLATYGYDDIVEFGNGVFTKATSPPPDEFLNAMVDCLFKVGVRASQSTIKSSWISGCKRIQWGEPRALEAAKRVDEGQQFIDEFNTRGRVITGGDIHVKFWYHLYGWITHYHDDTTPPKLETGTVVASSNPALTSCEIEQRIKFMEETNKRLDDAKRSIEQLQQSTNKNIVHLSTLLMLSPCLDEDTTKAWH